VPQQAGCRSAEGQDSAKREGRIEDQKPCGKRECHVSIFRGVRRILSAGQKQKKLNLNTIVPSALDDQIFDRGSGQFCYVFLCRKPFGDHG
jgi:hypothetical protein